MPSLQQHVSACWRLFQRALESLQGKAADEVQIELYQLALSFADLSAADVLLEYLEKREGIHQSESDLKHRVSAAFIDEVSRLLVHRLRGREADYQLSSNDFRDVDEAISQLGYSAENWCELGQAIRQRQGRLPPDHLDEEKTGIRNAVSRFADEVVAPLSQDIHRLDLTIPDEIIDGVRSLGCFGLSVPKEYGGLRPGTDEDSVGMAVVTEELSRGSLGAAGSLITRPEIMVRALLDGGTPDQQSRWLPGLAKGEPLCAIAVTEPDTGSDVASVALRATKAPGGWLLNGSKIWCTFAGKAGVILVLARTDDSATPPHRGLSLFVIEKPSGDGKQFEVSSGSGGRLTGSAIATIGYRGMHSYELSFEEFFVPDANLVGEEGGRNRGFYFTMRGFSAGRLQTAARACGLMRAGFEAALRYAEERIVFGQPIATYALTLQKLARMFVHVVAVQQFSYSVARLMDRDAGQLEASLVKLLACRSCQWVTSEAMQIHGGMGYAEESPVSRFFVDSRVLPIFEGTEEVLALKVVGKSLLERATSR